MGLGEQDDTLAKLLETYRFLVKVVLMKNESKLPQALGIVESALATYPEVAELHSLKANVLIHMGRHQEALDALNIASSTPTALSSVQYNYGLVYSRLGDLKRAEEALIKALRLDPANHEALLELGMLYYRSGGQARQQEGENM